MLAIRIGWCVALLLGGTMIHAQDLPVRQVIDPLPGPDPISTPQSHPDALQGEDQWRTSDEPVVQHDWNSHEPSVGNGAELREFKHVEESCPCGRKHCPGVCRDPGRPEKPRCTKPGDVDRGDCPPLRYRISDHKRAGRPHCVACWARCGVNDKYSAWFVGGGAAFCRGRCRKPSEGTWGLDYDGLFGHVNNWLKYTRGREQGGEGSYATDGEPEFVSRIHNVFGHGH